MTETEIQHLNDTLNNGMNENMGDAIWQKAFSNYNLENNTSLNMAQIFNYSTVLEHFTK
jgi:hypothetical protein